MLENKEMNFSDEYMCTYIYRNNFILWENQPHGDKITHFFFFFNKQAKIDSTGDNSGIN